MASITTLLRKSVMPLAIAVTASCSSCEKKPTPEPQPKLPENLTTHVDKIGFDRMAGMVGSEVSILTDYAGKTYNIRNSFSGGGNENATFSFQKPDLTDANTNIEIKYGEHDVGYLEVTNMPANQVNIVYKDNAMQSEVFGVRTASLAITPNTILGISPDSHKENEARDEWEKMTRAQLEEFVDNYIENNIGVQRQVRSWYVPR